MIKHGYANYAIEKRVLSEPMHAQGGEHSVRLVQSTLDTGVNAIQIMCEEIENFGIMVRLQECNNE